MKSHYRGYRLGTLVERVVGANLAIVRSYYFNYLLFAPIWTAQQISRFARIRLQSENEVNSPLINPFGVSALVFARKSQT
jgi:hypothetical protein